ncbi:MAG: hypothetical protein V4622_13665 [Bacteroidota bacterium]
MEKIKFIILVFIFFCGNVYFSQDYKPFKTGSFWGIKCQDSVCIESVFDEIYQDKKSKTIFHTKKDNLYGLIHFDYSIKEIKPISKSELQFVSSANFESYYYENFYSYIDSKGKKMFISSKGKFKLNCNPETLFAKKEGKFYYLFGLDTVGSENKPIKALNTKFLYLEQSKLKSTFIAQNLSEKFGLINCIGDTILPFEYTSIDFMNYDGDGNHHILLGVSDKKVLYHFYTKKIVPFYFDDIQTLESEDYTLVFKTKLNDKLGLFCTNGLTVLPIEHDEVFQIRSIQTSKGFNNTKYYVGLKNGKYDVLSHKHGDYFDSTHLPFTIKSYDIILKDQGYIKNGEKYDKYNLFDGQLVGQVSIGEISWQKDDFVVKFENGKFGLKDVSGNILIPFEYSLIGFYSYFDEYVIGFKNNKKYFINILEGNSFTEKEFWEMRKNQ